MQALQQPRILAPRRAPAFSSSGAVLASLPPAGGPQPSPAGIPEARGSYCHGSCLCSVARKTFAALLVLLHIALILSKQLAISMAAPAACKALSMSVQHRETGV